MFWCVYIEIRFLPNNSVTDGNMIKETQVGYIVNSKL